MLRRVLFDPRQRVTTQDMLDVGLFPQQSFDHYTRTLLLSGTWFSEFPIAWTVGATEITVGRGLIFIGGLGYINDTPGGAPMSLLTHLPGANRRYITVYAFASEQDEDPEPRTFLTDPATGAMVGQNKSTEEVRWANLALAVSDPAPEPNLPSIASNQVAIADILVDPGGIVSLTYREANRAPSLQLHNSLLADFTAWRTQIGAVIDTLQTQLASLASRIIGLAPMNLLLDVARDLATTKETLDLPDDYKAYHADLFLDDGESNVGHVDYLAKIEEGIRFPHAAESISQLALLNASTDVVRVQDDFMLPAYDEYVKVANAANVTQISVLQWAISLIVKIRLTRVRRRIRHGRKVYFSWSSTTIKFETGVVDPIPAVFQMPGETFAAVPGVVAGQPITRVGRRVVHWHHNRRRGHWRDKIVTMVRWREKVTTWSHSGATFGQTFLNADDGWLTGVDLYFSAKASTGDVHMALCEVNESGNPDPESVVDEVTVLAADLKLYPTPTPFNFGAPHMLESGKRYALLVQTTGAHYVAMSNKNNYVNGSFFQSTDGAWYSGSLTNDLAFRLRYAKFRQTRVEVQMSALQLAGGILGIDINAETVEPSGTNVEYEVQLGNIRYPLTEFTEDDPLVGLPALLPLWAVFTGTRDLMPGIGVGANSRVVVWRPRSDYRHVSDPIIFPSIVDTIYVDVRAEDWRGAPYHTLLVRLMHGASFATLKTASVITDEIDPTNSAVLFRRYQFDFSAGNEITTCLIRIEGTTDNVVTTYGITARNDVGLLVTP